jgi:stress-induced morphogen
MMIPMLLSQRFGHIKQMLTDRMMATLKPKYLQIEDESRFHSRGEETHFKMLVVSDRF